MSSVKLHIAKEWNEGARSFPSFGKDRNQVTDTDCGTNYYLADAHAPGGAATRDQFLTILQEVRRKYDFVISGYVVMPEHVHLLMSEPKRGDPSTAMQVLKQRTSRAISHSQPQFWQLRFYDFNVWSGRKTVEKIEVYASESGDTGLSGDSGRVAMEQLQVVFVG